MTTNTRCPYRDVQSWAQAVTAKYQPWPEYAFLDPNPDLPNVLLIGDSISMSYTVGVRERLAGQANVYRAPDNCRSTRQTRAEIETYLGSPNWDVIHFNWGIHDVTLIGADGKTSPDGSPQVPLAEYQENLEYLVPRLEATGAKLIWAATTPVAENVALRQNDNINAYNEVAAGIMAQHSLAVDDLHQFVKDQAKPIWADGVHYTAAGADLLAGQVAASIAPHL